MSETKKDEVKALSGILNISSQPLNQVITLTNNEAKYYSEQSRKFALEAKNMRDSAKYYAEQNSNVTTGYIDTIKNNLEAEIALKQDSGDYALRSEIPSIPNNLSDFNNDIEYLSQSNIEAKADQALSNLNADAISRIKTIAQAELNNPYTLFDSKYSYEPLYNSSWLLSNGQWNAKSVYVKAYEALQIEANVGVNAGETVTLPSGTEYVKRGLSVKLSTESYSDYDYVLNTTDETFRLPIKMLHTYLYTSALDNVPVVGNGMTIGITDGTNNAGILGGTNSGLIDKLYMYGVPVGTPVSVQTALSAGSIGITTDPTKSGMVADMSGLTTTADMLLYFYIGETIQNANLINVGRISEIAANKLDTPPRYVVEKSPSSLMPSWYVVYNDGWIEQGGFLNAGTQGGRVVNLLKSYSNSNYTILTTIILKTNYNSFGSGGWGNVANLTENSFGIKDVGSNESIGTQWYACGY